jgi:hypothetical protein
MSMNPEKGSAIAQPFQGLSRYLKQTPEFSLRSNPGLKFANAFGVYFFFTSGTTIAQALTPQMNFR